MKLFQSSEDIKVKREKKKLGWEGRKGEKEEKRKD